MIPLGTLCLIVSAPDLPEVLGMECTITRYTDRPEGGHIAQLKDRSLVYGPKRCFLPLKPLTPDGYIGYRNPREMNA